MKDIAIVGAGGFGLEIAVLIEQINQVDPKWNLIGFFDDKIKRDEKINDWKVLGTIDQLNSWPIPLAVTFALGISKTRQGVVSKIRNPNLRFPTLIHPSSIIGPSRFIQIGKGSIICAGNIITSNIRIGDFVIINLACTVGHETEIGDFSSFMPNCNISGEVNIGVGSFWGTGAKVINQCKIGDNTTIGAGAVVVRDLPDGVTAVGVPAKIIKSDTNK